MSSLWYVLSFAVSIMAYYAVRRWIAYRVVNSFWEKRDRLGNPINRTLAEIESVLGPTTQSPEGTDEEQIFVLRAEGRFSVLGVYESTQYAICTLRFENGICVEDISQEHASSISTEDVRATLDELVASGWKLVGIRMKRTRSGMFRGGKAKQVLCVEFEQVGRRERAE